MRHHFARSAWLAVIGCNVAALLFFVSPARAQVAAPSIVPFTFVGENPATMQWGGPSRLGAALGQADDTASPPTNPAFPKFKHNLSSVASAGAQVVGNIASFGLQGFRFESTNKPNKVNEYTEGSNVGFALRLGNYLSVGISQQTATVQQADVQTPPPPPTQPYFQSSGVLQQGGVTLRLGEWFFIGGSAGVNSVRQKDLNTGNTLVKTDQNVQKYGAGIRTYGGLVSHLEYYVIHFTDFSDKKTPGGRSTARTGVAEFNLGGFLIAYNSTHTDRDSGLETDAQAADIGYAPFKGLSVVAHAEESKDTYPSGLPYHAVTRTLYALALTYLFGG